jgi:hypothetical protein
MGNGSHAWDAWEWETDHMRGRGTQLGMKQTHRSWEWGRGTQLGMEMAEPGMGQPTPCVLN